MFIRYHTSGFVLSLQDRGEADKVISLYTEGFGKIRVKGKGIRRSQSKLSSGIGRFFLSDIEFVQGRSFKTLVDARARERFLGMRQSLFTLSFAARMYEEADAIFEEGERDERAWKLFARTIPLVEEAALQRDWRRVFLLSHYFRWNLLSMQGYAPQISSCVKCEKRCSVPSLSFAPLEGGIVCNECSPMIQWSVPLLSHHLDFLRRLFSGEPWSLQRISMDRSSMEQLEKALSSYMRAREFCAAKAPL